MADLNFTFDDSQFQQRIGMLGAKVFEQQMVGLRIIGDELLRLSQLEVPFDTGHLMGTGISEREGDEQIVAYNTDYAAKVHENPQWHFQNGRKGKYLEDPMKKNLVLFRRIFNTALGGVYG